VKLYHYLSKLDLSLVNILVVLIKKAVGIKKGFVLSLSFIRGILVRVIFVK
jgi:hypothetical protein